MKAIAIFPKTIYVIVYLCMIILIGCNTSSKQSESESSSSEQISSNQVNDEIYISCKNIDSDIYQGGGFISQKFYILSNQPLNVDDIKVEVPVEADYEVETFEINIDFFRMTDYLAKLEYGSGMNGVFPYYIYQCYRGVDWVKMRELYEAFKEAEKNKEYPWQITEEAEAVEAYKYQYIEDYNSITKEELPMFYVYSNIIFFTDIKKSESFQNITITIGEEEYEQNIGEIRLHPEIVSEQFLSIFAGKAEGLRDRHGKVLSGFSSFMGGDGMMMKEVVCVQAKEELMLEKLYLYESDIIPIGAFVTMSDEPLGAMGAMTEDNSIPKSNIGTMEFYWDLKTPISVPQGCYVSIELVFQDSRAATQLEYGARMILIMDYTIDKNVYSCYSEINLDRMYDNQLWLRYAVGMCGLDMESYFNDYYHYVEEWREKLPK